MRRFFTILAFIGGGIFGAVLGSCASFFGLYALCRVISRMLGNNQYMMLMWAGIVICPVIALACFIGVGYALAIAVGRPTLKAERHGFEMVVDSCSQHQSGNASNSSNSQT